MADAKIRAVITAEDRASGVLKGFDNSIGRVGGTIRNLLIGGAGLYALTKGVRILGGFIGESIDAFQKQELATTRLQAGINNVRSAIDKNVDSLLNQASALEANTRFSDEAIVSAQGILTTFQLNQQAIEAITPNLLDMSEGLARVTGQMPDLEGNAMLVAKAIGGEDTEGLVFALRRAGVSMNLHQQEVLKTGNFQERLAIVTSVLKDNFNNMAISAGDTSAGAFAKMQNALNNLQEQFGGAIAKAIQPFILKITEWARTDQARATIQAIADKVANMIVQFGVFVRDNWPQIKSTLMGLGNAALFVVRAIAGITSAIQTAIRWLGELGRHWLNIGLFISKTPIRPLEGRQMGGRVAGGVPVKVGEAGPETFVPSGPGTIVPNHEAMGGNVTLNVNIGMFAGTPLERRKIAETMLNDIKDIANMTGQTPAQLLGA